MDSLGIARMATDMKTIMLQSEMSIRTMKMAMDMAEQAGDELVDMIDSILTGTGLYVDTYA